MPNTSSPRKASMQFWPRRRARRPFARVRCWPAKKECAILGFAGYKAGMTHIILNDTNANSMTKNTDIVLPVTVIECPPLKIFSIRFYHKSSQVAKELQVAKDKVLARKITPTKKDILKNRSELEAVAKDVTDIRIVVYTQPSLTGIGKKKPELFEMGLSGSLDEKISLIKNYLDKEIQVTDIVKAGELIDIHAVTSGRGFQGPVKRFGVKIRGRKSEKTKRGPGSLGPWISQGHIMHRVAHAGQTGYHTRTEFNKPILKIGNDPSEVNPKGGFINYGLIKNNYILIKGSIGGPKKRLIRFNCAIRPGRNPYSEPDVVYIGRESKQKQ